jgi:Glycosyltransferase WbsX
MIAMAVIGLLVTGGASAQEKTLVEWTFDKPGDLQGWVPANMVADVKAVDGMMTGRITDWDPFLFSPDFEITPSPWQRIEVRMKCPKGGGCEFFWANGQPTEYSGFAPGKETPFEALGDNEFHVYQVRPFWHAEKKIVKLRLDLMREGGDFAVDWVRIVDPGAPAPRSEPSWDFRAGDIGGWTAASGIDNLKVANGALTGQVGEGDVLLLGPPLSVPLEGQLYVSLRMKVSGGESGAVRWAVQELNGLHALPFSLRSDGRFHTYNIDMSTQEEWKGTLIALGLKPMDKPGATFEIADLRVASDAVGAPDVAVTYLGPLDAITRTGKRTTIGCVLVNHGGQAAEKVKVSLGLPGGARLAPGEEADRYATVEFAIPERVEWKVMADKPGEFRPSVTVAPPGGVAFALDGRPVRVTPALNLPKADYVPEPKPVPTDYLVGTYYFPGWASMRSWQPIEEVAPERKPVLGWYDESSPEVVDWQIKWAAEHGISFFMVDWYWSGGGRSLEHWLHNGYLKSRYRKYLKFALMWANHNAPNTHSVEDWRNVTQYWIDHYLKLPEYLQIDGKPAVFIWAPTNIRRDLGGVEGAAKLYAMSQEMARAAGLKGISFVAMGAHGDDQQVKDLVAEGYEGATTYHWFETVAPKAKDYRHFPWSMVAEWSKTNWEEHDALIANRLLYIPTVDTGWSSEPWHRNNAMVVYGRTPELFERICRDAKDFVDARGRKIIALGPCNEWGEGSYIEPCAEFGFDMYDVIRKVFCRPGDWPPDVAPIDVGLGPYDYPRIEERTAWEFDKPGDAEGWGAMMGMGEVKVADGVLASVTTSRDPAFTGPVLRVPASRFPRVLIRMRIDKASPGDVGQLFWETATAGISEAASVHFPLVADGQFHDYVLEVGKSDRWRGIVRGFRLDPCGTQGATVSIDAIRLLPK